MFTCVTVCHWLGSGSSHQSLCPFLKVTDKAENLTCSVTKQKQLKWCEVKMSSSSSPLAIMGFPLLRNQHFTCTKVWVFCMRVSLFVSRKLEMSYNEKPQQTLRTSPVAQTESDWVLVATCTNLSIFPATGNISLYLCHLLAFNLAFPIFFPRFSDPLTYIIRPPADFFITALIFLLCPSISWPAWLSSRSLTPARFQSHYRTPTSHTHSVSTPLVCSLHSLFTTWPEPWLIR